MAYNAACRALSAWQGQRCNGPLPLYQPPRVTALRCSAAHCMNGGSAAQTPCQLDNRALHPHSSNLMWVPAGCGMPAGGREREVARQQAQHVKGTRVHIIHSAARRATCCHTWRGHRTQPHYAVRRLPDKLETLAEACQALLTPQVDTLAGADRCHVALLVKPAGQPRGVS